VGKVHELAVDAEDGRQVCVVFSNDSFMGRGSKLFAMPLNAFEFHATESRLMLESSFVLGPARTLLGIACAISGSFAIQMKARELGTSN